MGGKPGQSRRERLRAATTSQIKITALNHLARDGSRAISLRAVAREMGVTAGAIYSYFDTREALITALIADLHAALADRLEAACRHAMSSGTAAAILAFGRSYREWAIANPRYFDLIHGHPADERQTAPEAAHRAPGLLAGLLSRCAPAPGPAQHGYAWADFDPRLVTLVRAAHPGATPAVLALALRLWARIHGLVALEVYGHLGAQTRDPAKLFHAEVRQFARAVGAV